VQRLGPDLYRLAASRMACVHLVVGDVPTLIDAGPPGRGPAIERELVAMGVKLRRILLTHGDPDHVGGSDHLRSAFDAEVWAPSAERPLLDRSAWAGLPRVRRTLMRAFFGGTPAPVVDRWFDAGMSFDGLASVATPGHTPGHVVYEWGGWLIAGDAFVTGPRFRESLGIFTLDRAESRRTIEDLAARRPRAASSSHGAPARDAAANLEALIATWR
jgi:glyoxylase-like metal-dependent hydrolase (beta-lactamase superfamily II)